MACSNPACGEPQCILAGAGAPEYFTVTVYQGDSDFNLAVVTGASFRVIRSSGEAVIWSASIETQTATELVLKHEFAALLDEDPGSSEVACAEDLCVIPVLAVPGGLVRAKPMTLSVKSPCKSCC